MSTWDVGDDSITFEYDNRSSRYATASRHRVHVRQDSEGRWFWYHPLCSGAHAGIPNGDDARSEALAHAALGQCPKPVKPYGTHIEVDPDANELRASWVCPYCKQYCASHNPCDCCDDWFDEFDEQGQ